MIFLNHPGALPLDPVHWWDFNNSGYVSASGSNIGSATDIINGVVMATQIDVQYSTALGGNGLNSAVCVPSGGGALHRMTTSGLLLTSQPIWVSWVGKVNNGGLADGVFFYLSNAAGAPHAYGFNGSTWQINSGTILADGSTDTNAHIFYVEYNGTSSKIYVDGSLAVSGNAGTGAANGNATLFNVDGGGVGGTIYIGEILMGNGTNSTGSIALEYARLTAKWI